MTAIKTCFRTDSLLRLYHSLIINTNKQHNLAHPEELWLIDLKTLLDLLQLLDA